MSRQAGTAPSANSWDGRTGRELSWKQWLQSAADPSLVTVFLLSIVGLLVSLCLAFSIDIPAADTLLAMPG